MIHFILVVALLSSSPANAVPCWIIKRAVARYGEATAESWARGKGFTGKDIEQAKRCLRS